jgi:hypothetical protein
MAQLFHEQWLVLVGVPANSTHHWFFWNFAPDEVVAVSAKPLGGRPGQKQNEVKRVWFEDDPNSGRGLTCHVVFADIGPSPFGSTIVIQAAVARP